MADGRDRVMGASGAVEVLYGKEVAAIESPEEKAKFVAEKEKEYNDKFSNPYNAARYGYIDDVIDRATRASALSVRCSRWQPSACRTPRRSIRIFRCNRIA